MTTVTAAADDGLTFTDYWPDTDLDGFGDDGAAPVNECLQPAGRMADNTDCDDTDPAAFRAIPKSVTGWTTTVTARPMRV